MQKTWKYREFVALLTGNGYILARTRGDHRTYRNTTGKSITIPYNGGEINRMMARRLIKENGLIAI